MQLHPCTFPHQPFLASVAKPHTRQHQVELGKSRPSRWIPGTHVSRLISLSVTSGNNTSPRHNCGYFKMFLVIEASCTAVMTHGSAFSDDNSATVSFIPSLVLGLIHLNEKAQMEHNGQDLSQSSWHRGGGKWRKRRITVLLWKAGWGSRQMVEVTGHRAWMERVDPDPLIYIDSFTAGVSTGGEVGFLPVGQLTSSTSPYSGANWAIVLAV